MQTIAALIAIVSPASLYPTNLSKNMPATILSRQNNVACANLIMIIG